MTKVHLCRITTIRQSLHVSTSAPHQSLYVFPKKKGILKKPNRIEDQPKKQQNHQNNRTSEENPDHREKFVQRRKA